MKVKLIENNKIIDVPHWIYTVIDNKKVILDQEKKIIGIVIEENKYLKWVRSSTPLVAKVDGKKRRAIILK